MRISLFADRCGDPQRVLSVETAAATSAEHGASLLVLPGWCSDCENPSASNLQKLADKTGVSILAEVAHTMCFRPHQEPDGPFNQQFAQGSKATRAEVEKVTRGLAGGDRIIEIDQKSIAILLCGENNILRNVRARENEPQPRFPDLGWPLEYDVLVNPAHTSMRQWNLLHKRFAYFSQTGRTSLYCTNNTRSSWRTSLCVYRDGNLLVMGDLEGADKITAYRVEDNWRLVIVEIP